MSHLAICRDGKCYCEWLRDYTVRSALRALRGTMPSTDEAQRLLREAKARYGFAPDAGRES